MVAMNSSCRCAANAAARTIAPARAVVAGWNRISAARAIRKFQNDLKRDLMRARNLKPSIFKNEHLARLGPWHFMLFEGLWCLADREGRLEDRPDRIEAEVFPFKFQKVNIQALLVALAEVVPPFIIRYQREGIAFIQVVNFHKHQTPHFKEIPSSIQPASKTITTTQIGASTNLGSGKHHLTPDVLTPDSPSLIPKTKSKTTPTRAAKKPAPAGGVRKPYLKPDPETNPSGALICAYKERRGVGWDNRDWDRKHYARANKLAIELITTCGDLNTAWRCVKEMGNRFTNKGLDWNLSTIVKHSDEWLARQRENDTSSQQEAEDYAHMGGQSSRSKTFIPRPERESSGFRSASESLGALVERVRNSKAVQSENEGGGRVRNPGDDGPVSGLGEAGPVETETD